MFDRPGGDTYVRFGSLADINGISAIGPLYLKSGRPPRRKHTSASQTATMAEALRIR